MKVKFSKGRTTDISPHVQREEEPQNVLKNRNSQQYQREIKMSTVIVSNH